MVLRTLRNRVRNRPETFHLPSNTLPSEFCGLLTRKSGPYDLRDIAVRMVRMKNAEAEVNTYGNHIWMIGPWLEDERTNIIYNDNRINVLFCHGKN